MSSWASFYRGLANEARERAAQAANLSVKDNLEEVAREWSELADWAERKHAVPAPRQVVTVYNHPKVHA
jgi:hypothetical protein